MEIILWRMILFHNCPPVRGGKRINCPDSSRWYWALTVTAWAAKEAANKKAAAEIKLLWITSDVNCITHLPIIRVKAGNPAVSFRKTRGFPTPSHDGCGFISFPALFYPESILYQRTGAKMRSSSLYLPCNSNEHKMSSFLRCRLRNRGMER